MALDRMRNHLGAFTLSSVSYMIANGIAVWAVCESCGARREIDLVALGRATPGGYSLVNRRCRCRLTPGCNGWNVFEYRDHPQGPVWPLYDLAAQARWAGVTLPKWPAFPKRF